MRILLRFVTCLVVSLSLTVDAQVFAALRNVALTGTAAPEAPNGALFGTFFNPPAIGAGGKVGFIADMQTGPGGVTFFDKTGIWAEDGNSLKLITRQGDPAPDTPVGATFNQLLADNTIFNDVGQVAFRASLNNGSGGITSSNDTGIWSQGNGSLALVAREGSEAPGLAGTNFQIFITHSFNAAGQTAFHSILSSGLQSVWSEGSGSLALLGQQQSQAAGAPLGAVYDGFGAPVINRSGHVAFAGAMFIGAGGVTVNDDNGVWSEAGGGGLALIARENSQAPDTPAGAVFDSFEDLNINDAGQTTFAGRLKTGAGGVTNLNRSGIWQQNGLTLDLLVRADTPAPGAPVGAKFGSISNPAINATGQLAFKGGFQQGPGGVDGTNDEAIFSDGSGTMSLVAREGSQAPGTAAGTLFSNSFGDATINAAGQTAFTAFLAGSATNSNNQGLWAEDADHELHLIARKGDQIDLGGGDIRTLFGFNAVTFLDGTGGQSGSNNGIDADGQLVFSAFFSDASQAILVSDLVASVPSVAGDIDGDDDVDGADYLQIQRDNLVLISQWEVQYGTGPGSLSSSTAVPEPSSLLLLVLGMMAIRGRAR